eukprot:3988982-Ditylum_brightwellii.AAC.1
MSKKCKVPRKAKFDFEWLLGAARKNSSLLRKYGFDMTGVIGANKGSKMEYGSEFSPVVDIGRILCHHKFWGQINASLTQGVKYPMKKPSKRERIATVQTMLEWGNHKSAKGDANKKILERLSREDMEMGFSLPLLPEVVNLIVKGEIYPMGIHHQTPVNERGELVRKDRTVHDLSYSKKSGKAINQQIRKEELAPCIYGFTFL